jgi:CMP-N,N'-diacetyllegionaminic acid synthase
VSTVLAVIPARAGSRGVPGKNLRVVAGRPLIAWTIAAARNTPAIDRAIVSTDSSEIADVARAWGAEVPFLRPRELALDDTPGLDPVLHVLETLDRLEAYRPDFVMLLQPTSPLRTAADIESAIGFARAGADSVVSVSPVAQHPAWMKRVADGYLDDWSATDLQSTRQQLEPLFVLNGAIYLARTATLVARRSFYGERTRAYVMPPERSIDIDSPWDLHLADLALRFPFGATE